MHPPHHPPPPPLGPPLGWKQSLNCFVLFYCLTRIIDHGKPCNNTEIFVIFSWDSDSFPLILLQTSKLPLQFRLLSRSKIETLILECWRRLSTCSSTSSTWLQFRFSFYVRWIHYSNTIRLVSAFRHLCPTATAYNNVVSRALRRHLHPSLNFSSYLYNLFRFIVDCWWHCSSTAMLPTFSGCLSKEYTCTWWSSWLSFATK